MRTLARLPASVVLLALGGLAACLPPPPPPWLVTYPITWGISTRVVAAGRYAQDHDVDEPGRMRAEMMPEDTLEWRWHGAGAEGSQLRPPIWLLWRTGSIGQLLADPNIPDCPQPVQLSTPLCRLGEGERVQMTLGHSSRWTEGPPSLSVVAIASDGDILEPETCLQRALTERDADLRGCLISIRSVRIGPLWLLYFVLQFEFPSPVPLAQLPGEFLFQPANFNPTIARLRVDRSSPAAETTSFAADGDTLTVRPGETITVRIEVAEDAAQDWVSLGQKNLKGPYLATMQKEDVFAAARLDVEVDDYLALDAGFTHRWTAPDDAEPVTLYIEVHDSRSAFTFATLRFVGEGVAP